MKILNSQRRKSRGRGAAKRYPGLRVFLLLTIFLPLPAFADSADCETNWDPDSSFEECEESTKASAAKPKTELETPPPAGMAELYLYRVSRSIFSGDAEHAFARDVIWSIDGQTVGRFSGSGYLAVPVAPGRHSISGVVSGRPKTRVEMPLDGIKAGERIFLRYTWPSSKAAKIHRESRRTALNDLDGVTRETALVRRIEKSAPSRGVTSPTTVRAVINGKEIAGCVSHALAMLTATNSLFSVLDPNSKGTRRTLRFTRRNHMELIKGYRRGQCKTAYTTPRTGALSSADMALLQGPCDGYAAKRAELKSLAKSGKFREALNEKNGWVYRLVNHYDHAHAQYCRGNSEAEMRVASEQNDEKALKKLRDLFVPKSSVKGYTLAAKGDDKSPFLELLAVDPPSKQKATRFPGGYSFYRLNGVKPGDVMEPKSDRSCFMDEGWACSASDGKGPKYAYKFVAEPAEKKAVMRDYRWFMPAGWGELAGSTQIIQGRTYDPKTKRTGIDDLILIKTQQGDRRYLRIESADDEAKGLRASLLAPQRGLSAIAAKTVFSGALDPKTGHPQGKGRCTPLGGGGDGGASPFACKYASGRIQESKQVAALFNRRAKVATEIREAEKRRKCEAYAGTASSQARAIADFNHDRLQENFNYILKDFDRAVEHWNSHKGVSSYQTAAKGYPPYYDSQGNKNAKEAGRNLAKRMDEMMRKVGPKSERRTRLTSAVRSFERSEDCGRYTDLAQQVDASKPMIDYSRKLEDQYSEYVRDTNRNMRQSLDQIHASLSRGVAARMEAARQAQFRGMLNSMNKWRQDLAAQRKQNDQFLRNLQAMQRQSNSGRVALPPMGPGARPLPTRRSHSSTGRSRPAPPPRTASRPKPPTSSSGRAAPSSESSSTKAPASARKESLSMRQAKRPAPKREEDLGNTGVFNVKGGSDYYYADRAHARNLAQLEAQQTAPKYCKSSNHAKVIWVENWCKQKKEMGEPMYRRYQTAEIHCQAQRCRQSYCGTGVR